MFQCTPQWTKLREDLLLIDGWIFCMYFFTGYFVFCFFSPWPTKWKLLLLNKLGVAQSLDWCTHFLQVGWWWTCEGSVTQCSLASLGQQLLWCSGRRAERMCRGFDVQDSHKHLRRIRVTLLWFVCEHYPVIWSSFTEIISVTTQI